MTFPAPASASSLPAEAVQKLPLPLESLAQQPQLASAVIELSQPQRASNRRDITLDGGHCQIAANDDLSAIYGWLNEFDDSPQTQRNYRKEAERLLLWALRQRGKSLSGLNRDDLQAYQLFLMAPEPAHIWCGPRTRRDSPKWRPFTGPLSNNSARQALIIINALFSYLVDAGYLHGNPLSLIRRRNRLRPQAQSVTGPQRYLDQSSWQLLKQHLLSAPRDNARQINHDERNRFLFHLLYLMAPRVSEVSSHNMNSFRLERGRWWWYVLGKGQKEARVPVGDDMLEALKRYRRHLGLEELPANNDHSPLLRSINGTSGVSANMVYRIVKQVLNEAAAGIKAEQPQAAALLRQASTHWFRHTSVTHGDDAGVGLKYLQRSARHNKLETTALYQHADDALWHQQWQKLKF